MDLFKNWPIDLDFIWLEQFSTYSSMYFNIVCSSASISKPKCCPDQGCIVSRGATLWDKKYICTQGGFIYIGELTRQQKNLVIAGCRVEFN